MTGIESTRDRPHLRRRRDAGFSLAAIICLATAMSIALAVAVPSYQMQAKRQQEIELIFRGEEYMRAIQKFNRRFPGAYPPTIDALLETNGIRFLRRQYKDPITDKDFRLISINADGSVIGSIVMQRMANQPIMGGAPPAFGLQVSTPGAGQGSGRGLTGGMPSSGLGGSRGAPPPTSGLSSTQPRPLTGSGGGQAAVGSAGIIGV